MAFQSIGFSYNAMPKSWQNGLNMTASCCICTITPYQAGAFRDEHGSHSHVAVHECRVHNESS